MLVFAAAAGQRMSKQNLGVPGVSLAWDASPEHKCTVGYYLYYGTVSGNYTSKLDAGNNTTTVVSGLVPGSTYYFAAAAYDASGDESLPSNETSFNLTGYAPPLIASQPASLTNIAGTMATFTVSASGADPFGYQWLKNTAPIPGATKARTLTLASVADADAAAYSVIITNAAGSVTSSSASLSVLDAPLITSQPIGLTNLAGTSAIFTVTATGASSLSYQWVKDGTNALGDGANISGSGTARLTLSNVLGADAANYTAVISNAAGSVTSEPALLAVLDPIITNQPVSVTGNAGTTIGFSVGAQGTSPAYQWLKGAVPITGATNATLNLASVSDADTGGYSVIVSNAFGSVTSLVAGLNVIDPLIPLTIVTQPVSGTNIAGATAILTISATGNPPLSYQWLKNSIPINGATNAILSLAGVADADVAVYQVIVSDASGSIDSSPAALTVMDPPLIASQPEGLTNNAGTSATFTVVAGGTAPLRYQWFQNGTNALVDGLNISGSATPESPPSTMFWAPMRPIIPWWSATTRER